jgi:erythromycin esterase-like protein
MGLQEPFIALKNKFAKHCLIGIINRVLKKENLEMAVKKKDKSDQILKKLEVHDKNFKVITNKLEEHDRKFIEHDKKLDVITKKLEEHDQMFGEFRNKFSDILTGQDKIIKELETAREDRVFAIAKDKDQDRRLNGLEDRVQKVEAKIS